MCQGPEDTPSKIKACLRRTSDHFLAAMAEDWGRYGTANSIKMQKCINEVINERKEKNYE